MNKRLLLVFFLLLFIGVSCSGVNLPYVGFHAFNFNIYSLIAHNYLEFGLLETKLAPVVSITPQLPPQPVYYLHHPPLISLVLAGVFFLFGEEFWVGRLAVIIFSVASMYLLYLIGGLLKDKKFGLLVLAVGCLLPASALFGRMIGQEALVLFFCLSCLYSLIRFIQTKKKLFLFSVLASIILGTLTDWPMVYFIAALFPYMLVQKRLGLNLLMLGVAGGTAGAYLLYILWIQGNFSDLMSAFFVRSFEAHGGQYWWLRWITLLAIRFAVYFNPMIVLLAVLSAYRLVFLKHKELYKYEKPLLFSLGLFGLTHILLYPAGSFGHPYWMYYFVPFFSLLVARITFSFSRVFLILLLLVSVGYLIKTERWKTGETEANVWRYSLAESLSTRVPKYSLIAINQNSAMDFDVLEYKFLIDAVQVKPQAVPNHIDYYAYSCMGRCDHSSRDFKHLLDRFQFEHILVDQGELYVFHLDKEILEMPTAQSAEVKVTSTSEPAHPTTFQNIYTFFIEWLDAPQI